MVSLLQLQAETIFKTAARNIHKFVSCLRQGPHQCRAFILVPLLRYHHEILQLRGATVFKTLSADAFKDTMTSEV